MQIDREDGMETTEYVLQSLSNVERQLQALTAAIRADEIVGAVNGYLGSWSSERIANLQKLDGGWGPFDYDQRPETIYGIAGIVRISEALRRHCRALKDAGIEPVPELLELDLYFSLAMQAAENFFAARPRSYSAVQFGQGQRRRSDMDKIAA
jgi:hypothetical protein